MKLTLEEIQEVLSKKVKDTNIIDAILKDLEKVVEDKKEELEDIVPYKVVRAANGQLSLIHARN